MQIFDKLVALMLSLSIPSTLAGDFGNHV